MTGMTYDRLRASRGIQWPDAQRSRRRHEAPLRDGVFPTPTGRAGFQP